MYLSEEHPSFYRNTLGGSPAGLPGARLRAGGEGVANLMQDITKPMARRRIKPEGKVWPCCDPPAPHHRAVDMRVFTACLAVNRIHHPQGETSHTLESNAAQCRP